MMMPPGYPPPMFMMPPPGMFNKPRKSFARVIFTTFASILLTASIGLNIYMLVAMGLGGGLGLSGGKGIVQTVLVEGDPKEKIAVVPITGVIMEGTFDKFDAVLNAIDKDPTVKGLVIEVETPGGGVTPSDEIYARILRFRAARSANFPVVVTMGQLATSGGYYVSCAANYVIAQRTTLTGNIGVLMPRYNMSKLAEKYGVEEVTVTAPAKGFKNAGSMLHPIKPDETAYLQGLIDDMYGNFKNVVQTGRQGKLPRDKTIDEIANGKVYTATEAKALGLIDQIGYAPDAYAKAASMAGLTRMHVVKYSPKPPTLMEVLSGGESKSNVKVDGAGGVTINGVNVNLDASLLEELGRPRALYMWRGQ